MTKKFIKDNRGQVLYAVLVTVMFLGVLSMITMGLTLQNYHATQQKQAHVTDYYAADAAAELLRIGEEDLETIKSNWQVEISDPVDDDVDIDAAADGVLHYEITNTTVTIKIEIEDQEFTSWEVSYHAKEPAE